MRAVADRPVIEVFPVLANLGYRPMEREIKNYSLAGIVNSTPESSYTVHTLLIRGERFDLRLTGLGDDARFYWVSGDGSQIGDSFERLTGDDIEQFAKKIRE